MKSTEEYIRQLHGPLLVLGASGFIGANLFRQILTIRSDVYAVVKHSNSWRLDGVVKDKIIECDLTDYLATKNLIAEICPKTVFDCVVYGAYSFEEELTLIYETNFQSLINLVDLLAKTNINAFIHAGSSSEYGLNSAGPSENDQCEPNSHYSVSKVSAANFLTYMGKNLQFPCIHLRLYSVYGPLEDTSRLIPNLMRQVNTGTLPHFVDSSTSRDFVYVDYVCRAFIVAAVQMNPKLYGENFNIGSGIKTTIGELASLVKERYKIEAIPVFGSMEGRKWDMPDWYANPSKAIQVLGWHPNTSLEEGLKQTADWVSTLSDEDFILSTKKNIQRQYRSVTAVVACYKDELAIPYMHRRLTKTFRKLDIDYEIIFVNDCSPDKTALVIQDISAKDHRVIGITHSRNFGSQMAFRSGMELATKNSVVFLDGDLQDPPELIEQFHHKWTEGFDVVYGRRIKREVPWYWDLLYKGFYRAFAAFSYLPIAHDAGDFSLMDRRVVGWLLHCNERDLFMRGLRAYVGFNQTGVDYIRPERMFGKSTNNLFKNIEWAKRGIFSFSNTPLTMLTTIGVTALILSIILAVTVGLLKIFYPDIAPKGSTTLLIVILIFGSFNLFAVGLVGEYVAKIMIEVKHRPGLIRASLIRKGSIIELLPDGKVSSI